jgi:hypothetical protein
MNPTNPNLTTRMPADVDVPDKVLYGLTFRQLAILAIAAVIAWVGWRTLHSLVPVPVLLGAGAVVGALTVGLVVGRRDGLSLDRWLLHAVRHSHQPHALTTAGAGTVPDWVDAAKSRVVLPAPLRLPVSAIDDAGQITLSDGHAAIVATTGINLALRTADEQAGLIDTYGRWLNSLSHPTQVVVSARPVDLTGHARTITAAAPTLPHPALEAACHDHAAFLEDLAHSRDPLHRQVLIVTRTPGTTPGGRVARRRAEDTARALSGLGVTARALNGAAAIAAIAATADPYTPPTRGPRATATTGPPAGIQKTRTGK